VIFDREVDRSYHTAHPIALHDSARQRILTITGTGSHSAILWNPWIAKAKALTDLPDEDYQRFVCVETANAHGDSITLQPGGTHLLSTAIGIS